MTVEENRPTRPSSETTSPKSVQPKGDNEVPNNGSNSNPNTPDGQPQPRLPKWKVMKAEYEAREAAAKAASESNKTMGTNESPLDGPVEDNRGGIRPGVQHPSGNPLEEDTLNGVAHPELYTDAIPDVNTDKPESVMLSDKLVEDIIGHADPAVVFPRWGKGDTPRDTSGDEVTFRCPMPSHEDHNPSASLNRRTKLWTCFSCETGGDMLTLGGIRFGMDPKSSDLPELKRHMVEDLVGKSFVDHGPYRVMDIPQVQALVDHENKELERHEAEDSRVLQEKLQSDQAKKDRQASQLDDYLAELNESLYGELVPEPERAPAADEPVTTAPAAPSPVAPTDGPAPSPTQSPADDEGHAEPEPAPRNPAPSGSLLAPPPSFTGYNELLKHGTFLSEFYQSCEKDSSPNDFHFFHGLAGLGFASGHNVTLADTFPVTGNLYICFAAGTGSGKSTSNRYLTNVLRAGLPFDETNRDGVKVLPRPGSGEGLTDQMTDKVIVNPNTGIPTKGRVKGYLNYDELASLIKQATRQGSTIDNALTSMYDGSDYTSYTRGSGEVEATEPYLTMTSNVPPEMMRTLFTQGEAVSGFLNRFTFVTINERKPQTALGRPITPDYDYLGSKLHEIMRWAQTVRSIVPDDDAGELMQDFFDMELARYSARMNAEVNPMLVRLELMFKKFCLLFAVNEMSDRLTAAMVEKAIKLYWITKPGYEKTSEQVGRSVESELEDHIVERLIANFKDHGEPRTAAQIWGPNCQAKRKAKKLGLERFQFDRAIKSLVSTGELEAIKPKKGSETVKYQPADPNQ